MTEQRADGNALLRDGRKTLFLVDRSDSFIMYLRILLERMGFRVVPLKKLNLLREMLPIVRPDLVLLGSPEEGADPIEALASLRAAGAGMPVVLISPQDEDDLGFDCRTAGFAGCLSRPISIFRLFRALYDSIVFASGEKRVHLRTPFRERVEVTRRGETSVHRATSLSEGGIFVRVLQRVECGEAVTVVVPLGFGPPERLPGVVIYSRATLGDGVPGEIGIAVRFSELTQEQSSRLTVCILSLLVGDILEDQEEPFVSLVTRTNSPYEDIVTAHIRLGQELRRQQLQLRSVADALPLGLLFYGVRDDGALEPLSSNPAAARLLGSGAEQPGSLLPPERWGAGMPEALRRVAKEGGSFQANGVRVAAGAIDGCYDFVVFQPAPGMAAALVNDATQRKRAEEEVFRVQKLESLGFLAGGIAHDFNNLLQAVSGSVETALALLGEAEGNCPPQKVGRVKYLLAQSQRGVGRAAKLAAQLLTFARGGDPVILPLEVGSVVSEAVESALRGWGFEATVEFEQGLHRVAGDAGQLRQAFSNVAVNARQALPQGGRIAVRGENVTIGPGHAFLPPGEYVRVSISDTGVGIPGELLPKVCDPYFTTRQAGSGLGLSSALSVVHKHGGWLDIASRVGVGTTVSTYLPVAAERAPASSVPREHGGLRGGRALVMDDEPALWPVSRELLGLLGFDAVCVPEGREMLRVYEEARAAGTPFEVVIMDLTVCSGMGGEEAIRELLKRDPAAKAIVSSGYADAPALARCRDHGFRAALPKPFSGKVLSLVLEEVLA